MSTPSFRTAVALFLVLVVGPGCGNKEPFRKADPNRLAISGEVLLHKKPLTGAMISFEPVEKGLVASGATVTDGKFQMEAIDGLAPGKYLVKIYDLASYGVGVGGGDTDTPRIKIPPEYNERSSTMIEVKAGEANYIKLDLK
jgi:hypothetical protein